MNKKTLLNAVVADLMAKAELYDDAARTAHADATHEENQPEDPYDTRGLEASFLAAGQSRQTLELERAIATLREMPLRKFAVEEPIDVGALVELEAKGEGPALYFIGPCAGGTEVVVNKRDVLVLTMQSPLGQQIAGRRQGDRLRIRIGGQTNEYKVLSVS